MLLYAQVPIYFCDDLPKNRQFTRLEAAFQYDTDRRFYKERSKNEYAKTWGWDWGKVDKFIKEINNLDGDKTQSFSIISTPEIVPKNTRITQEVKQCKNKELQGQNPNLSLIVPEKVQTLIIEEKEKEESLSLLDVWNKAVSGTPLPSARTFSKARKDKCITRLKERSFSEWEELFQRMTTIPFLCGDNDRKWNADFDWIISNEENAVKVLEGKYQKTSSRAASNSNRYSMFAGA